MIPMSADQPSIVAEYEVPYTPYEYGNDVIYRPMLTVALVNNAVLAEIPMLVDTGADLIVLDAQYAYRLGIELNSEKLALVANSDKPKFYEATVTLGISQLNVFNKCRVLFSPGWEQHKPNLLGRLGLMEEIITIFIERERKFYLSRYNK